MRKNEKYELIINNVFWLLISWAFALFLYFFMGIKYVFNLNIISFGYILLFWGLFVLGQYASKFILKKNQTEENEKKIDFTQKINLLPIFIMSLISVIAYGVYIISINDIQFGFTRDLNTNALATLFLIVSSSSLVVWLHELAYSILNGKRITWYGLISAIIYNLPGVIMSGRDALMIFLVATVIVFLYCVFYAKKNLNIESKIFKTLKKIAFVAGVVVLVYLLFLSNNRYGADDAYALFIFKDCSGAEFPQYLENIYYRGGGLGKIFFNVVFYYSSQISKLALMFEQYDGPYLFGLYQLHYISRLLPETWNLNYSLVVDKVVAITAATENPGFKVFWETAIGYSIYDFGRIGSLFVSFICGIITGKVVNWCNKNKDILSILMQTFICVAMFLTIEISPLFDYYYVFPLFWMIVVILWSYRRKNVK